MEILRENEIKNLSWSHFEGVLIPVSAVQRRRGVGFELVTGETTILIKAGRVSEKMRSLEGCEVKVMGIKETYPGQVSQITPVFYRPIRKVETQDSLLPWGVMPLMREFGVLNSAA